ncbi:hypothetical protein DICVIV_06277 [Dictyocaulus viviparus]|uniref:DUF7773 domain-containing protein n=1 Tax=Dictyocaulus viviparus TaxID=29172 RepID=A0A0D8XSI9_DICVI|nr:hypothetical protein DICVIV_06277 [Dictyocaulus viviparus]
MSNELQEVRIKVLFQRAEVVAVQNRKAFQKKATRLLYKQILSYEHLWWNMFIVSILTDISSSSLICYDSSAPRPRETVECGSDMMCYSEYYAVNRSGTVRQYFDRFCVHRQHCEDRGIDEKCQTLQQLDKRVQVYVSTFNPHRLKMEVPLFDNV